MGKGLFDRKPAAAPKAEEKPEPKAPKAPKVELSDAQKEARTMIGKHGLRVAAEIALDRLLNGSDSPTTEYDVDFARHVLTGLNAKNARVSAKRSAA